VSYWDVTVVVAGAVDEDRTFGDSDREMVERGAFLAEVKRAAESLGDETVEVYELFHDHPMSVEDCACAQYLTDHHPSYTSAREE